MDSHDTTETDSIEAMAQNYADAAARFDARGEEVLAERAEEFAETLYRQAGLDPAWFDETAVETDRLNPQSETIRFVYHDGYAVAVPMESTGEDGIAVPGDMLVPAER